jgi:hypothetical protein
MSEEIDVLIKKKEAELLPFCLLMEELRVEFTRKTVDFAVEWYRKTVKEYITKHHDVTLKMSEERIGVMKEKVNTLVKNADKTVQREFDNPALWWHQKPILQDDIDKYKQVADKYPQALDRAVRRVLGNLGTVLEEFRFNVTTSNTGTYQEFWFENSLRQTTVPCYPHLLEWTKDMQGIIQEYDAQFTKAIAIYKEIVELKDEKKRQEALTRWDSI